MSGTCRQPGNRVSSLGISIFYRAFTAREHDRNPDGIPVCADEVSCFMNDQTFDPILLRLKMEYAEIGNELVRMSAELKQTGIELIVEGQKLIASPEKSFLDAGSLSAAALHTERLLDRYRVLLAQRGDKGAELESLAGKRETAQLV